MGSRIKLQAWACMREPGRGAWTPNRTVYQANLLLLLDDADRTRYSNYQRAIGESRDFVMLMFLM